MGAEVDDRQFEQMLTRLLRADVSAGTEAFRDALLARCLGALDAGPEGGAAELDDAELEMLAAAGDAVGPGGPDPFGRCPSPDARGAGHRR